jgi:lysophospholipase L1-like esterase
MSIKGFEVGGVQERYDYTTLDNTPANLVQDANYVHTDNNFTNADKTKLDGIEANANKTVIDATLTQSRQAADAKATGDELADLKSAFDTEISAIRDGLAEETTSYPTVTTTSGKYLKADGSIGDIGNSGYKVTNYISVNGFTTAIITGAAGTNLLICAFYDANQTYIPDSGVAGADAKEENKQVAIPTNASYIVVAADSRATAACALAKWSYDFADKYEDGYIRSVTRWKVGDLNSSGQEIYNAHPAITQEYLSTTDYDFVRRSDSYQEGWIYYYTLSDSTYTFGERARIPLGCDYVLSKLYTHFRLRLFDGWSNTIDLSVASNTFGLFKYKTFATRPVWLGKTWAAIGDSLTEFNTTASLKYHALISERNGIAVINLGDGGTGYKATDGGAGDSFMDRVSKVPLDADVVTIFGSGNDLGSENEIGTPTDTGTTTLCGCINTTIDNLLARMPLANLGIVTPTPWQQYNPANDQNKMALYAAAIVTICKNRGIPCLDLYHCSGLRPWDSTFKSLAYANADGVHPNNVGHALIAPKFQAFLDTLLLH